MRTLCARKDGKEIFGWLIYWEDEPSAQFPWYFSEAKLEFSDNGTLFDVVTFNKGGEMTLCDDLTQYNCSKSTYVAIRKIVRQYVLGRNKEKKEQEGR